MRRILANIRLYFKLLRREPYKTWLPPCDAAWQSGLAPLLYPESQHDGTTHWKDRRTGKTVQIIAANGTVIWPRLEGE